MLADAARRGLRGDERFDWLVDRLQELPQHRIAGSSPPKPRPEFARLFEKFRIGKTTYTYRDTATGKDVPVSVRRCRDCHPPTDSAGSAHATAYIKATRGLTSMIGRAERILLKAQRGGVEVRKVRSELDGAIDSQIELETLVHTFAAEDMKQKQSEGLRHAEAALLAGQGALDELGYRRRGLLIALGVIVLTLALLATKIRML